MHVADWTFSNCFSDFFVKNNMMLKGIVHPKRKIWCLSAYPQGIQDVGDFISSVEHKQRLLTRTVAVCQSYNVSQWNPRLWETKQKTYTDKTKLNLWLVTIHWGLQTRNNQSVQETKQYFCHAPDVVNTRESEVINDINTVQFLAQTDCFVS